MKGIPEDDSDNGGGFVFDCRFLKNPYWNPKLRAFTGKDKIVQDFFENQDDMKIFFFFLDLTGFQKPVRS